MLKELVFSLLVFFMGAGCLSAGEVNSDLKEFVRHLSKEASPSLSDYYRFYGEGAESELRLELNVCERKGWTPALRNSSCWDYIKYRNENRKESASLYFEWLKTKLPESPEIEIIKTERIRGKGIMEHDLIHVKLDGTDAVFFRTVGAEYLKEEFGVLGISMINSVHVQQLLDDDLKGK